MAKLKLVADPTFKARVGIPLAGNDEEAFVELTFRHRSKADLSKFTEDMKGMEDTEVFMAMVTAWDLEDPFTTENVKLLMENYIGSGLATFRVYLDQLTKTKLGN